MTLPPFLQEFLEPWLLFLSDDPLLRIAQIAMLILGVIAIFLVFYTTRDILLRTHSFILMFLSILLVAALPGVGFFLYLLLRPPRTLKEREIEALLYTILGEVEDITSLPSKKASSDTGAKKKQTKKSSKDKK